MFQKDDRPSSMQDRVLFHDVRSCAWSQDSSPRSKRRANLRLTCINSQLHFSFTVILHIPTLFSYTFTWSTVKCSHFEAIAHPKHYLLSVPMTGSYNLKQSNFYCTFAMVFGLRTLAARMRSTRRATSVPSLMPPLSIDFERQLSLSPRAFSRMSKNMPPFYSLEQSSVQRLCDNNIDGAWWCSICKHENTLVHRVGPHPFARLQCANCEHVFDKDDISTQVLDHLVQIGLSQVDVPAFEDHDLVPYGMICPGCGLSYRAKEIKNPPDSDFAAISFGGVVCRCGRAASREWYRFSIGTNWDWMRDQAQCYGRALRKRLERVPS